jgi:streptogramin lyase
VSRPVNAAIAAIFLCAVGCSGDVIGGFESPATPAITASPSPELPPNVLAEIPIGGSPCAVAEAGGSVWITAFDGNELDRIDPETNEVTDVYPMPTSPCGMTEVGGKLWVQAQNTVVIFDPVRAREVDRIRGGYFAITPTPAGLWAVAAQDAVVQMDPRSGNVLATVKVPGPIGGLAVAPDGIWTTSARDQLVRIDPRSRSIVQRIPVKDFEPEGLAVHDGVLWVSSSFGGEVLRIDAGTGRVEDHLPVADSLFGGIVIGDDYWVADSDNNLYRLDGTTGEIVDRFEQIGFGPYPAAGNLWTVDFLAESAYRLDRPAS